MRTYYIFNVNRYFSYMYKNKPFKMYKIFEEIYYSKSYDSNIILLIVGSIVLGLFPFVGKKNEMTRSNGILFVLTYILYMIGIVCFA